VRAVVPATSTIVAHAAQAAGQGNQTIEDYDLAFKVDTAFNFPGAASSFASPIRRGPGHQDGSGMSAGDHRDNHPNGTNRLVGTFKLDVDGEYPWDTRNAAVGADVPYVQIKWTRCGDGMVTGNEKCDDGNADNTRRLHQRLPACGVRRWLLAEDRGVRHSVAPGKPDPFCDDTCHLAAVAKGSGCSAGGGVGLVAALVLSCSRGRGGPPASPCWSALPGQARRTPRARPRASASIAFEMAPSVEDGLVVQDPAVLKHLAWSVNATLGFTDTLLRVVPKTSDNNGVT